MTQKGIVTAIDGACVTVLVARASMCGDNCASCKGGCTAGTQQVLAVNEQGLSLSVGDSVQLKTDTGKFLGMTAAVYFLPLAVLFIAYFCLQALSQSELVCALGALAATGLCLILLHWYDRFVKRRNAILVRITEILHKAQA